MAVVQAFACDKSTCPKIERREPGIGQKVPYQWLHAVVHREGTGSVTVIACSMDHLIEAVEVALREKAAS